KTYAMTGWRVGYLVATRPVAEVVVRMQEATMSCVSSVSQAAALAALAGPQDCVGEMRSAYRRRRDLVVDALGAAGVSIPRPSGAFYAMVPVGGDSRAGAISLAEQGVAVAPGTAFGTVASDHVRVSLASADAALREGVARIVAWRQGARDRASA